MSDDTQKLGILVGVFQLANSQLFESVAADDEAKRLHIQDIY